MALIDDLKGILGEEAIEKIKAGGLDTRITRGDEVLNYLDDGKLPPEVKNTPPPSGLTLEDLTKTLKTSLTEFETSFATKMEATAEAKAKALIDAKSNEFYSGVLAQSTKWADEISDIKLDHRETFGEKLDLEAMRTWAKENNKPIDSPKAIYDEFTREKRTEKMIEAKAEEKAKTIISARTVPGVSPASSTGVRAALKTFGKAVNAEGKTRAEVLNEKLASLERAS